MFKILLTGCGGRMGNAVMNLSLADADTEIVAGVDPRLPENLKFPVYQNIFEVKEEADAIIDFSFHTSVFDILKYSHEKNVPVVISTTGHTPEEREYIFKMAKKTPIFFSANMSIGVNLISELAKKAAAFLPDFDIEIVEKHHNQKLDAPSGTALMLADEISKILPYDTKYVYDRHLDRKKREREEIGIHSVRGGNIVGDHDIIFAGPSEVVTISHTALSRDIFAHGALCAAKYMFGKPAGLYNMSDFLNNV